MSRINSFQLVACQLSAAYLKQINSVHALDNLKPRINPTSEDRNRKQFLIMKPLYGDKDYNSVDSLSLSLDSLFSLLTIKKGHGFSLQKGLYNQSLGFCLLSLFN